MEGRTQILPGPGRVFLSLSKKEEKRELAGPSSWGSVMKEKKSRPFAAR